MKFTCEKVLLETAVSPLSRIVSAKATLPILENILIEVKGGEALLAATDLEVGMKTFIPAKVEESGITTVPARVFFEVLSNLGDGLIDIHLDSEAGMVELSGEGCKYKFNVLSADGYPVLPEVPKETKISIPQENLKKALRDTLFSASPLRDDNQVFSGVLYRLEKGALTLVALDGHRLAKRVLAAPKADRSKSVIIPARALTEVLKILNETPETADIYFGEHQVFFKLKETIFFSRLIEGQFPQYQLIIPEKSETALVAEREPLLQAVKRAAILAQERESPKLIKIALRGKKLVITANTQDLGQAYEEVPVEETNASGKEVAIGFNARYISDVLSVLECAKVRFEFGKPQSPGVIRPESGEESVYVIMPVRPLGEVISNPPEAEGRPLAVSGRKN